MIFFFLSCPPFRSLNRGDIDKSSTHFFSRQTTHCSCLAHRARIILILSLCHNRARREHHLWIKSLLRRIIRSWPCLPPTISPPRTGCRCGSSWSRPRPRLGPFQEQLQRQLRQLGVASPTTWAWAPCITLSARWTGKNFTSSTGEKDIYNLN